MASPLTKATLLALTHCPKLTHFQCDEISSDIVSRLNVSSLPSLTLLDLGNPLHVVRSKEASCIFNNGLISVLLLNSLFVSGLKLTTLQLCLSFDHDTRFITCLSKLASLQHVALDFADSSAPLPLVPLSEALAACLASTSCTYTVMAKRSKATATRTA